MGFATNLRQARKLLRFADSNAGATNGRLSYVDKLLRGGTVGSCGRQRVMQEFNSNEMAVRKVGIYFVHWRETAPVQASISTCREGDGMAVSVLNGQRASDGGPAR